MTDAIGFSLPGWYKEKDRAEALATMVRVRAGEDTPELRERVRELFYCL
jgi:hypothetical protein